MGIVLTQSNTFIIGSIAKLLGFIMNGIFNALSYIGIENIGLTAGINTIEYNKEHTTIAPITYLFEKNPILTAGSTFERLAIVCNVLANINVVNAIATPNSGDTCIPMY